MSSDTWLPKGHAFEDGNILLSLLQKGEEWQIFEASGGNKLLLTRPSLSDKWIRMKFLDEPLFTNIMFENTPFTLFRSRRQFFLSPVDGGESPENKVDCVAFSLALKESRKIDSKSSFHDAIYVEQYSRLLPTWTLSPRIDDDVVLGTWISGGVAISVKSFRRLSQLIGWLPSSDVAEIVVAAGFDVPRDAAMLSKRKSAEEKENKESLKNADWQKKPALQEEDCKRRFSLPGRPHLEEFFNEHVIDIIFNIDKYRKLGIDFPPAIVLYGPSGCGKTYAVERLVEFLDWPSFPIDSQSVGSPYIHDTSKKISETFEKAMEAAPSVLIIDEMESFLSERNVAGTTGLYHLEEVAEFLRRIPEAGKNRVLVIAMTNMIDMIDSAILRRGRFDHVIEVGMPTREEVSPLLRSLLGKVPIAENLYLDHAVDKVVGAPLSDVAFLVREAARLAAKVGKTEIDQSSLDDALARIPGTKKEKRPRIGF